MNKFERALSFTLRWEGGFSDHPSDPGGATMRGITQAVYNGWRRAHGQQWQSVKFIDTETVHAIYKVRYWDAAKCEVLGPESSMVLFDIAVNHGVGRAAEFMRKSGAVASDDHLLARTLIDHRVNFYYALVARRPKMRVFLKGWLHRAHDLKLTIGY